MREYKTLECGCPTEALTETISLITADQMSMGYQLYKQQVITTSDNTYSYVFFWFARDE